MHTSQTITTILSSALLASLALAVTEARLESRQAWPRCTPGGPGICTIYIASGHGDEIMIQPYRNFALFDNNCKLTSAYETTQDDAHVEIKGHLPETVKIEVQGEKHPKGTVTYQGKNFELGDELECYESDEVDGVACRRHILC